jgi:hypothetical protein
MTTNEIIIILLLILIIIYLFKNNKQENTAKQETNKNRKLKEMFDNSCSCSMDYKPVECDDRIYSNMCNAMCVEKNIINCKEVNDKNVWPRNINEIISNYRPDLYESFEELKAPVTKFSSKIHNIMIKIVNKPTEEQLVELFNAVTEEVPNTMEFLIKIQETPTNDEGKINLDVITRSLLMLMILLFNTSNGKYFPEIKKILPELIHKINFY